MKVIQHIIILIFSLAVTTSFAQEKKIKKALENYDNYAYANAIKKYEKLIEDGLASAEVYKKLGNAYYFNADLNNSVKPYSQLIALNETIEPEYYFRYAHALKSIEDYATADKMMKRFESHKKNDIRAKLFENAPTYLQDIKEHYGRYSVENALFNSKNSDFGPSYYGEDIIFSSGRSGGKPHLWNNKPFLNLFMVENTGTSLSASKFSKKLNTKYHESTSVFTKDGNTMYFTRNNYFNKKYREDSEGINKLKIFRTIKNIDGNWEDVTELPFNSDEYSVAHPALSPDEKTLYFASDMPGTTGESDIYMVSLNDDGSFGEPRNLGEKINTEARETFPFVSKDGMLYFASDGHLGLGGLDVFMTNLTEPGDIYNLGEPLNSPADDFSFIIDSDTKQGYFASNRDKGVGSDDIYMIKELKPLDLSCNTMVNGKVVNKNTGDAIANTSITIFNSANGVVHEVMSDGNGKFSIEMDCRKTETYKAIGEKEGFEKDSKSFALDSKKTAVELSLNLEPTPPVAAAVGTDLFKLLNLNPIYFDFNKSFIRPDAQIELAKVIDYMNAYPSVKIDVRSHTDSRGRDAYNYNLSNKRNRSTIDHIIDRGGISRDRVSGNGYGETEIINRCTNGVKCSDAEHEQNRRSEFIVVSN